MTIFYIGSYGSVVLTDGQTFPNGEPVEVSNELGQSLTAREDFVTTLPVASVEAPPVVEGV